MVLITGGAGYIGSHINKTLHQNGYETIVLDNLKQGHKQAVKWGILEIGDLADTMLLDAIFEKYTIEAVFHTAAVACVGESIANPSKYYNNNVANTLHFLDAMVRHGIKHIIFSSSCAVYGFPTSTPVTEDMAQNPINPYGRSKRMIEEILEDYHKAYGLEYCSLRYFNAAGADLEGEIGESHHPETHLLPLLFAAAAGERETIDVFGMDHPTADGSCIRDYIHVTDLADAHLCAMKYLHHGGKSVCLNLGNGKGYSVLEVIEAAKKVTGKSFGIHFAERRAGDPSFLVSSTK